jgi:hypothetical protein
MLYAVLIYFKSVPSDGGVWYPLAQHAVASVVGPAGNGINGLPAPYRG